MLPGHYSEALDSALTASSAIRTIDAILKPNLPLKRNKWVHSLLAMCLYKDPHLRASANDGYMFLKSRFGK